MNCRAVSLVLALSLGALVACSSRVDASAWLAGAEAAHQDADVRLRHGDVDGARAVLRSAAAATAPRSAGRSDVRAVRQDLFARLATLELAERAPRDAAARATEGLALGRENDVFTANLLVLRGRALEQTGDAPGASRDYHDALLVTEALLDQSLRGSNGPP